MSTPTSPPVPHHVAIIMDGNQRWARQHNLPVSRGHRAGAEVARTILRDCADFGVKILTLFAFSSENWHRPQPEVNALLSLMHLYLGRELQSLHRENVRLRFIGDRDSFSATLRRQIDKAERLTAENDRYTLVVAAAYGGRWDIAQAVRKIVEATLRGESSADEITEDTMESFLSTAGLPPPDLCIRTGGEQRISNFLLWQMAYTEFYFCEQLWPDFDAQILARAFAVFSRRSRHFGLRSKTELVDGAAEDA